MRKLLVSAMSLGVLAGPATLAFAADDDNPKTDPSSPKHGELAARTEALDRAEATVERASERADERRLAAEEAAPAPVSSGGVASPELESIAVCESGGDPTAIGGGGLYRGKYQFTYETWASVGGSGDPAAASESEQDMRAQMLLEQSGTSPWPVCG